MKKTNRLETATFAAGCFWGAEEAFRTLSGVKKTTVGYTGGTTQNPSYEQACSGKTGHAEAVQIEFNPREIPYRKLLDTFWGIHNPTTLNRQGFDIGEQYRSAIFFHSPAQKKRAEQSRKELDKSKKFGAKIVTQIIPASAFYPAEKHHQKYLLKRNTGVCH